MIAALGSVGATRARAQAGASSAAPAVGAHVTARAADAVEVSDAPGEQPGQPEQPNVAADASLTTLELPSLRWDERWRRFGSGDAVFSGLMAATALATYLVPGSDVARWQGGIVADDAARDGLVLASHDGRSLAAGFSDGLMAGLAAAPVLIDAVLTAWLVRGSEDVAAQMMLIDFQAHALAQGLTGLVKWAVRRERPLARGCREDEARRAGDPSCEGIADPDIAPHSFFSGHTSVAFTSAALICLHHTELGLWGPEGDAAACVTGLTLASTVGMLRMAADRHYLSDVVIGAGVGLLSGWLLPYVLHYMVIGGGPGEDFQAAVVPTVERERGGLQVIGRF